MKQTASTNSWKDNVQIATTLPFFKKLSTLSLFVFSCLKPLSEFQFFISTHRVSQSFEVGFLLLSFRFRFRLCFFLKKKKKKKVLLVGGMFAFEVEERRRQALESKNKQSADTLSDFLDFKRWKRWNNSSTTKTTTTTTTLSSSSSLSSRAKDVSVDSEAKSSDRAASETAALAQTEQHHVSVHQTTAPEALRLVLPLTCTAQATFVVVS